MVATLLNKWLDGDVRVFRKLESVFIYPWIVNGKEIWFADRCGPSEQMGMINIPNQKYIGDVSICHIES